MNDERGEPGTPAVGIGPGWHPDPTGRYEFRWFNGAQWTADVSVDGQRYVDRGAALQPPVAMHRAAPLPIGAPVASLPRTVAVLSLVFGIISAAIAWVPFIFVVGAMGAIAAIVLGIVALRRVRAGTGAGRSLAIAGIATAVGAVCLCPVGVVLSVIVYDEVIEFTEPGPNVVEITSCTRDGSDVVVTGTLDNRDDEQHDYVIEIDVGDVARRRATLRVEVDDVEPGEQRTWTHREIVRRSASVDDDQVRCEVADVTGPYPFGVEIDR